MQLVTLSHYFFQTIRLCLFLTISLDFYHRPQQPGRPPQGPPLVPPLGGWGRPTMTGLASSRALTAPSSELRTSQMGIAALIRRQQTRQPQRGRYRPGRRQRGRLGGLCRGFGHRLHRYHRFQPRPLVSRLARLTPADDVRHHLHGRHSGGFGDQVDPVASPVAGPVQGCDLL
jgi:hypothetical protein